MGLEAKDGLLDRAFSDKAVNEDSLGLTDTMGPIHGLAFDGRAPPWAIEVLISTAK
ncbi:hypothetical protein ACFSHQ_24430 [Gemmobacter lanyuensis]